MIKNPLKNWGKSPESDWRIIFGAFSVLVLISIIVSWTAFSESQRNLADEESANTEVLNANLLRRTALYYDQKAANFSEIKATPDTTPDPSK